MISRRTIVCLGLTQFICWGTLYYLIGAFGELIVADLGWSRTIVHGGFSVALLIMAVSSPLTGSLIDAHGGRTIMATGAALGAVACTGMATAHTVPAYYAAWFGLGLAMRLTLYDAAFAALARLTGPGARRSMSQITLFGGLASSAFWPIGYYLAGLLGWRGALLVYAGCNLVAVPLFLAVPAGRYEPTRDVDEPGRGSSPGDRRRYLLAAALYAIIISLAHFLSSAMSAHMIGILSALGLVASLSIWVSALRGIGQFFARLCDVLLGGRVHPLNLLLAASLLLPICFSAGLLSGQHLLAAAAFAFLYGAANGIATIAQGAVPLVLFDHRTYGAVVGRLLVPSFVMSALSPLAYAVVIENYGAEAALHLSITLGMVALVAAFTLKAMFHRTEENA